MQAQAIRKRFQDGDLYTIETQLTRLANVAQEAHAEVRDSILSLKTGHSEDWAFVAALQQYLTTYRDHYGILTELDLEPETDKAAFDTEMGVQLMRVIQEALTNARKHGRAHCVQVKLQEQDGRAQIAVCDDGVGFDLDQIPESGKNQFGLASMRERMQLIGGSLTIDSHPNAGTQVLLEVPVKA
jgi:signal transduction histidine kinase